ncbi:MAG: FAD-dependent oxidoreductase [Promethearchaeota archaeon]
MTNNCLIIGGEIAALRAAKDLASLGIAVTLINFSKELGENTKFLQRGFSEQGENSDNLQSYIKELRSNSQVTILNNTQITKIFQNQSPFELEIYHNGTSQNLTVDAIILATGFQSFDASQTKSYGYGFLKGVLTIFDLEQALQEEDLPINENTERIIYILCVGSRTVQANPDCSTYCCSYSINQALRIKQKFPQTEVVVMYMDIRTVANQEFLYNEARRNRILFIRGRPAAVDQGDNKLMVNFEDSLADEQEALTADLVVLAIGGRPSPDSGEIATNLGVKLTSNGFVQITEKPVGTSTPGVFACGSAAEGIKNVWQSTSEGGAAAMAAVKFLKGIK